MVQNTNRVLSVLFGVGIALVAASAASAPSAHASQSQHAATGIPDDARYACPMDTHPDETDPARQGAYFAPEPGKCPWCGMKLKPLGELDWVDARRAAGDAEMAYTCPEHPHVFSITSGECPRCGRPLEAFKVMYTCPDPKHAGIISITADKCPECGRKLTPYRGIWLAQKMAERNVPPDPAAAEGAAYRCSVHPLAHSDQPGRCPICAAELVPTGEAGVTAESPAVPPDAKFVCPMQECWEFAEQPGSCAKCGMKLKPVDQVPWAAQIRAEADAAAAKARFVCPMHPAEGSDARGTCPVCGMQLVSADAVPKPADAPEAIATQVNYLMEHYLALHERFASDTTKEVALHSLGLVGAADEVLRHADDPGTGLPAGFFEAARTLRSAALKTRGGDLDADRVTFMLLSAAMIELIEHVRPSRELYPALHLFHCAMTKGDWIQTTGEPANPYYGFKMLKCGVRTRVK